MKLIIRKICLSSATFMALAAASCGQEEGGAETTNSGSEEQTTYGDVARETEEAVDAATRFTRQERDEYLERAENRMQALNVRISDLETEWRVRSDDLQEDVSEEWRQMRQTLQKERAEAAQILENLREASNPAWAEIRKGFEDAYEELSAALENAEEKSENSKSRNYD